MIIARIAATLTIALLAGSTSAQESIELPFVHSANDDPAIIKLWEDFGDNYIKSEDPNLNVFTATVETPEGDKLTISQLNSVRICSDADCPVRILRNEELVYDNDGCRYTEQFSLNASMRTLFMCDWAVPTISAPEE
jgi:hypothetical protein